MLPWQLTEKKSNVLILFQATKIFVRYGFSRLRVFFLFWSCSVHSFYSWSSLFASSNRRRNHLAYHYHWTWGNFTPHLHCTRDNYYWIRRHREPIRIWSCGYRHNEPFSELHRRSWAFSGQRGVHNNSCHWRSRGRLTTRRGTLWRERLGCLWSPADLPDRRRLHRGGIRVWEQGRWGDSTAVSRAIRDGGNVWCEASQFRAVDLRINRKGHLSTSFASKSCWDCEWGDHLRSCHRKTTVCEVYHSQKEQSTSSRSFQKGSCHSFWVPDNTGGEKAQLSRVSQRVSLRMPAEESHAHSHRRAAVPVFRLRQKLQVPQLLDESLKNALAHQTFQMPTVCQDLSQESRPHQAHPCAHWWETVQVHHLWQKLLSRLILEDSPRMPHFREPAPVSSLQQEFPDGI